MDSSIGPENKTHRGNPVQMTAGCNREAYVGNLHTDKVFHQKLLVSLDKIWKCLNGSRY